jgi:PAS domain S-box-containing protein
MLSRWIASLRPRYRPRETRYKHSLIRNVLIVLLLISLIPIILIGTLNYLRTQQMLEQQISRQLESIVNTEVEQLNQYVDVRNDIIERIVTEQDFHDYLSTLLNSGPNDGQYQWAMTMLYQSFRIDARLGIEDLFDQIFLIRPDGTVLLASDSYWVLTNFGVEKIQDQAVLDLIGTNRSSFVYNPLPGYTNQLVLFISRSFVDEQGKQTATLIATSSADLSYLSLSDSSSFLPEANAYYFTKDAGLIGVAENNLLMRMPENAGISSILATIIGQQTIRSLFSAQSYNNTPVFAYAYWLPTYDIGTILTVSKSSVFKINNIADPTNLFLLGISLIIAGGLIYFGGLRLVNPLVKLAHAADSFSQGNWDERVLINRSDEIGSLAYSFNHMADELSELYRSLESAVERRTGQLRIASEVAQLATSTTRISDALGRTAELIADRFSFYHVAIYLFDETGKNLVLKEASGLVSEQVRARGDQVELTDSTLVGWVALNNQARIISDIFEDPLFRPDELLPDTQSETAIPITIGTEVLGVLDIQSSLTNAFDEETVAVFQTLANQISSTMQATRLLETTQQSLQETAILYQATRQVIQARDEPEIIQILVETFIQLPFMGAILSVNEENFRILAVTDAKTGRVERSFQNLTIPIGQMLRLLTENKITFIEDIAQPSDYANLLSFLLRRGCKSAALVSVLEAGRLSKVLVLGSREMNQITYASLQPYTNLAEVVGASLEKYRVLNTLQKRLAELQILSNFSQAISAEIDLNHLYRVLHEQVIQTLGPDLEFAVAIYNRQGNQIEWPYYYENKQISTLPPSKLGDGLTSTLIQSRKPLLLENEKAIQAYSPIVNGKPAKSWMGIPLIFAGDVVGAILIQDLENEKAFTMDDVNLFMTLAPQIATSVRNTQLYTETQRALRAYDQERFLFNTLLDNIPEGISIKDVDGRYIRASESIAQLFQMNANDIIGKTDFDLFDRDTAEKNFRDEQSVMNLGKPEIGLIQSSISQSGREIWTHVTRMPIRTPSGDPYGLLLIQRDITELKQAESLSERRAGQLLTAAEIARDATGTLDLNTLLQKSVNLVRERFGFYHA